MWQPTCFSVSFLKPNNPYLYNYCKTTFNYNMYIIDYVTYSSFSMQVAAKQYTDKLTTFSV
jgi:hypothetical protein